MTRGKGILITDFRIELNSISWNGFQEYGRTEEEIKKKEKEVEIEGGKVMKRKKIIKNK